MLMLPSSQKVLIYRDPVDMRRSFDGLELLVREHLGADPLICGEGEYVTAVWRTHGRRRSGGDPGAVLRYIRSARFEEPHHRVFGTEAGTCSAGDAGPFETPPHHLHVSLGVAVGGGDLGMSQPRLDGKEVDP